MTPTNRRFLLAVFAVLVMLHALGPSDAAAESSSDTSSSLTWTLYHAIAASDQEPVFEKRGTVTLKVPQESTTAVLEVENVDLSSSSRRAVADQLLDVAGTPKMYQLKLVSDNDSSIQPILTTVSACQVLRAQFREEIILSFNQDANVVSMSYVPLVSPLAPKSCQDLQDMPTEVVFDSKISFELATPGMTLQTTLPPASKPPPGLKFFAKPKANGNTPGGGGPGAEPEPMTGPMDFFKRYWYVIVPLLLMNLFGGQAPEEEDKSAGTGGAARAPVANAAAGAAAAATGAVATAGTPSPKRRGKRG